jgi:hypothetical protein
MRRVAALASWVAVLLAAAVMVDTLFLYQPTEEGPQRSQRPSWTLAEDLPIEKRRFSIAGHGLRGPIEWKALPAYVQAEYTLNGKVKVKDFYLIEYPTGKIPEWTFDEIDGMITQAKNRDPGLCAYGLHCSRNMYAAFEAYPVKGKQALVVGTQKPWAEAALVAFGAEVTTVDFNRPTLDHPSMHAFNVTEMDQFGGQYDVVFVFSSLEHDGLGRYTGGLAWRSAGRWQ